MNQTVENTRGRCENGAAILVAKKGGNSVWETARGDQICFNDVFIPSNKKSSAKKKRDKSTAYFCLDTNYMITPSSEKKIMAGGETTSLLAEIKN